ncbi:MAG: preprotein translocase subunit SecG [Myxococcales bacterium]|jgi:preprotein translocase subunit SecG|nr:preprotein translocase subunit SecG [Myxococcales bacterium]
MLDLLLKPLTVVHVIACLFLVMVILLQPGKSGGMGAFTGAAATQVFGGRGAGNILTKMTWIVGTLFFVTSITLAYLSGGPADSLADRAARARSQEAPAAPPPATPPAAPAE